MTQINLEATETMDDIKLSLTFSTSAEALLRAELGAPNEDEPSCIPPGLLNNLICAARQEMAQSLISLRSKLQESFTLASCKYLREEINQLNKG